MKENFIRFENVKKVYDSGEVSVTALHDVSFSINKGEICVIVGESGAGKTTLLNILGGMDALTEGKILVDGAEVSSFNKRQLTQYRRTDVGFVFQFYNLIPNLTALENVEIAAKLSKNALPPRLVLEEVGLAERASNFPAQLSGGEQQRVAIARALANNPRTIIADEPTGNIDPELSAELMKLLSKISEQGTTMLVVTHEHDLVNQFAKRVIRIVNGRLASDTKGWYQE